MTGRRVTAPLPLLRAPPFPGSHPRPFGGAPRRARSEAELARGIEAIVAQRVGGTFWGRQPALPDGPYALVVVSDQVSLARILDMVPEERPVVCWSTSPPDDKAISSHRPVSWISGCCDPWHLVEGADEVFGQFSDELLLIASLAGRRTTVVGDGPAAHLSPRDHAAMNFEYSNPFTGEPLTLPEAVSLCGFWRELIDSNRPLVAAIGFAAWKRPTVAPLLWAGSSSASFVSTAEKVRDGDQVAMWKSRVPPSVLADLQGRRAHLVEVEDGFIRSVGLGAECVPPLSIVVDRLGAYFDPSLPTELEGLIERGGFSLELIERSKALRALIVDQGISKYAAGSVRLERRSGDRRHLLVVGQVEDDRSVMAGGGSIATNLELLRRVRAAAPDAFITYKPHPDVEAGHRVGAINRQVALALADEVVSDQPISALIDIVDEIHVNTSLAGFEALLRGRPVMTHGVPFYAGWGLTRDLGAVPPRRTARRTVDELVAAVLLLYPRYLDPETGLPCPPEILIGRLANPERVGHDGMLVKLRRLQGRLKRGLALLGGRRVA